MQLHIEQAKALRLALPDTLHAFAESSGRARALVLALLLSRVDAICARQMKYLEKSLSPTDLGIVRDTQPVAEALQPMLRLLRCRRFSPLCGGYRSRIGRRSPGSPTT